MLRSLEQALKWFQGDASEVKVHRFVVEVPDIPEIRAKLNLTQEGLAAKIGVPVATLRNWEQGRRYPTGPARVLLNVLAREPEVVMAAIAASETVEAAE
ncbi:DNA-binding transcriptional regulator [Aurantimonas sp. VKM B-3413]|uniref:helix-turn-helix domain-containing protein n=1 Tax=Aurantimonas sp. VKM B-3413 TaxID=2779401 RepID=UPI001E5C60E5|nr:helix-turn-helix domain-containing protein [Aurantimonas sp. VKM B-3413]MCB8837893.1 helix-turn-helix domain-containing protein [Aurantimonas sp. VKM B-3413]